MKWNVFGANEEFLAVVDAESEKQAMDKAKADNPEAVRVEEKQEHYGHQSD